MAARLTALAFSIPFNAEIINVPHYGKVKMPTLNLYDGAADPEEHLGVYKAHIYLQDVDDVTYCCYFPATIKGVEQS